MAAPPRRSESAGAPRGRTVGRRPRAPDGRGGIVRRAVRCGRTTACWAAVLAGALLVAAPARAFEVALPGTGRILNVTLTQTMIGEYHVDTDPFEGNPAIKYFDLKNRTDLVLLHGSTTFNMRLDASAFVGDLPEVLSPVPPGTRPGVTYQNHVALAKISLASVQRSFDITVGDFYIRVGRGLTLDLTRIDELVRDTTLRGTHARFRSPYVSGIVFGGWVNPLAVDDGTEIVVRVPADVIGGGRLEVRPTSALLLGLHYVGGGMQMQRGTSRDATHTLGGTVELPNLLGRISLYGEFDFMSRAKDREIIQGTGTYLGATGRFGPLAALFEFKYYDHLQFFNDFGSDIDTFVYNRPPTLMRPKADVVNNHDVIGARLKLDVRLGGFGTLLYVNYGQFFRSDGVSNADFFEKGDLVYDAYAGLQQPLPGGALDLSGGYRVDQRTVNGSETVTDYACAFFEGELSLMVRPGQTLELEAQYRKIQKTDSYSDFYFGAGYRFNRYLAAGFSYEYSSEFKDASAEVSARRHYGGVRTTVNFTPATYARLFGGSTHGGLRCLDGFCRVFPPFIGVKLELVVQL